MKKLFLILFIFLSGDKRTYAIAMPIVGAIFIGFITPCAIKIK